MVGCARCGVPIEGDESDPENDEMAVCLPCEVAIYRQLYQESSVREREAEGARQALETIRWHVDRLEPLVINGKVYRVVASE